MPTYEFACEKCGKRFDEFRAMDDRDTPGKCTCGKRTIRDVAASMRPHSDLGYAVPILSDAMGVHPSQVAEARRRFPDHEFHPDGRMVIRSHQQRQRVLKQIGYHDNDGYSG